MEFINKNKFPWTSQISFNDCGPTCLYLILKYYKKSVNRNILRSKFQLDRLGTGITELGTVAEAYKFRTLIVNTTLTSLQQTGQFPCIVLLDSNHYVIVHNIEGDKVFISDPAKGKYTLTTNECNQRWIRNSAKSNKGIALLLEPTPEFENGFDKEPDAPTSFSNLFGILKPHGKNIRHIFYGLAFTSAIQLLFPILTQSIVDIGIGSNDLNFIYLILFAQVMLFIGRMAIEGIRRWFVLHISVRINLELISSFLAKLSRLPLSFFSSTTTGDIVQRIQDHQRVERLLSSATLNTLFSLVTLVLLSFLLAYYSTTVFLIFIVSTTVYLIYVFLFLNKRKQFDSMAFKEYSSDQNKILQIIDGITEIKLNNAELKKRWEWQSIQGRLFKIKTKQTALHQTQEMGSLFINELRGILITVYVASSVINGELTLGMMVSIQYILGSLNGPIGQIIQVIHEYQDAKLSLERIDEIKLIKDEDGDIPYNLNHQNILESGGIELRNLSFRYAPHFPYVIKDVNLFIPSNKVTAIVGTSGSGKSTLLKLILKFYKASEGEILIGGVNANFIKSSLWRSECGVVMQDGFIFNDTVASNISINQTEEEIDLEKMIYACQVANIYEYINELPQGFNTPIGNEGLGLSAGQKQRILIARAVYKNPTFLFFDEATSALDTINERVIVKSLKRELKNKTVVVIAHRLSTIKDADQIVMMDGGQVVEVGSHAELVKKQNKYYNLVKNQIELADQFV